MYLMQFIGYFLKINLSFIFDILRYIILKTEKMSCILQFILGNLFNYIIWIGLIFHIIRATHFWLKNIIYVHKMRFLGFVMRKELSLRELFNNFLMERKETSKSNFILLTMALMVIGFDVFWRFYNSIYIRLTFSNGA